MTKIVSIASFTDGLQDYSQRVATVAVDVIRATTTAITALAAGRACYPVSSVEEALKLSRDLTDPLLVGEVGGEMPPEFHMTNSPAQLAKHEDRHRPIVLLSSSGTQLMNVIGKRDNAYVASFRNYNATIDHLARHHSDVAIIGAGSRGEFREEDQMCCAWIAEGLIENDFKTLDDATRQLVERWRGLPKNAFAMSRSVEYLRRSGQLEDLDFILNHFDDVNIAFRLTPTEVIRTSATAAAGLV